MYGESHEIKKINDGIALDCLINSYENVLYILNSKIIHHPFDQIEKLL